MLFVMLHTLGFEDFYGLHPSPNLHQIHRFLLLLMNLLDPHCKAGKAFGFRFYSPKIKTNTSEFYSLTTSMYLQKTLQVLNSITPGCQPRIVHLLSFF